MCYKTLDFDHLNSQTGYSFWGGTTNRQLIYFRGVAPTTPPASIIHALISIFQNTSNVL